ncbi:hypothetical protein AAZX31_20G071200 [Glycine max]
MPRLCAWHLIRNAKANVNNPAFLPMFQRCMIGDLQVKDFEHTWLKMVETLGLKMWSTAHIRGNFFVVIRTTSRCEAFHSHMGNYVNPRINLTDFVEQSQRSTHFSKEIFLMVQSYFKKATLLRVTECLEMAMYSVFPVVRYQSERTCHVSYCPLLGEFKCECLRMESTWLPCHHIIIVLLALHFTEFPESLLLDRWNKKITQNIVT